MIRHVLLVQFKSNALTEQIDAVRAAFVDIPTKIEGVLSVEWGENNNPEGKNKGFTHCIFMTFNDEATRERYLPHPDHLALVDIFRPVIQDILVLDYSIYPLE